MSDSRHDHDLEVLRVEPGPTGQMAYFRGEPPPNSSGAKFEVVRRLGEPHDVYAMGALFYFILTGKHEEVDRLGSLVNLLQEGERREITLGSLGSDQYYRARRDAIPEPFFAMNCYCFVFERWFVVVRRAWCRAASIVDLKRLRRCFEKRGSSIEPCWRM